MFPSYNDPRLSPLHEELKKLVANGCDGFSSIFIIDGNEYDLRFTSAASVEESPASHGTLEGAL